MNVSDTNKGTATPHVNILRENRKLSKRISAMNSETQSERLRSLEEVNQILEYAKLEPTDLNPVVQSCYFSERLDNDHLKLLELDETVLEALSAGDQVIFRGDKDEEALLCTKDKTYEVKEAETSNSMLILPSCSIGQEMSCSGDQDIIYRQVCSVLHKYYELRLCKPKLRKLKTLLEENLFNGRECEEDEDHQGKKYTYCDLLNVVQASEKELIVGLEKLEACLIDGYWRALDFDCLSQMLNHIIQLAEENDWVMSGMPLDECCQTLCELYPRCVIIHVVKCYCDQVDDSGECWRLNEDKICKFFAELSLRNAGKFNFKEFQDVWQQSVPQEMKTSLYQIEGMALIDRDTLPQVIWYFPVDELPEDVSERFSLLFKTRTKWTLEEITPYIKDMATEKTDVGALLTKYTRASLQTGIKVFSSRKLVP